MKDAILRVGDMVDWRGNLATVIRIERVNPGDRDGIPIMAINWAFVHNTVVDLDTGHRVSGHQIAREGEKS